MAKVIVTMVVRPEFVDTDLEKILESAKKILSENEMQFSGHQIAPLAFGLKQIMIKFIAEESKGSVDFLEQKMLEIPEVQSVEITGVSRAAEEKDLKF